MTKPRTPTGTSMERMTPVWEPLRDLVGEEVIGDFMWMFEVELEGGVLLQAYKHRDTRRYIHLSRDGAAFAYQPPDRYLSVDPADVLSEVSASLSGLALVTAEQIEASWRVVERLRLAQDRMHSQM